MIEEKNRQGEREFRE